jgi:chaperone modulatory protein CbpM
MPANQTSAHSVVILDEADEITLADLTRACRVHAEWVLELIEEGVIEPRGPGGPQYRFAATTVVRVEKARRLQRDLGVNLPGVALALELLDRIDALETRMRAASARQEPDDTDAG